ncbi:hypothetical protein ILP92_08575 [Maribius pontilimi]|uniref:Uncharacterized protein n=1 Tax=Palleronia pontilimi TaxID=1964209 RepID=A0A934MCH6_9RHOB|nr:hypothetical protein [Palleronia pontilimi]MBJ3762798.1 hypothetical protein [Palleronia pontilimi]
MSAPNTDVEKQSNRHKVPLVGMTMTVVWSALLLVALLVWISWNGNEPANDTPIDEEGAAATTTAQ